MPQNAYNEGSLKLGQSSLQRDVPQKVLGGQSGCKDDLERRCGCARAGRKGAGAMQGPHQSTRARPPELPHLDLDAGNGGDVADYGSAVAMVLEY